MSASCSPPRYWSSASACRCASEALDQAQREILAYSVVAAIGIVLLLSIAFRNIRNTLLVLANLPFALVGGVLAAVVTGGNLSVGSMVGFVTLFGITTRNSIMMISHFEHLIRHEGQTWGSEAAARGASERLTPVLMTAIVTALGLLPLALGSGEPGKRCCRLGISCKPSVDGNLKLMEFTMSSEDSVPSR
jgi:Cu/Ag efflux pump CusA